MVRELPTYTTAPLISTLLFTGFHKPVSFTNYGLVKHHQQDFYKFLCFFSSWRDLREGIQQANFSLSHNMELRAIFGIFLRLATKPGV